MVSFRNILCPVDFYDTSARALIHATALARWYDARLTILHVVPAFEVLAEPFVRFDDAGRLLSPASHDEIVAELQRWIAPEAAALDPTLLVRDGRAPDAIVSCATDHAADPLVLGTHGRSGFIRPLLGSVTEKVLHTAPCPVLTVPPATPATAASAVAFKQILCPVDFSPASLRALELALDLGRQADGCVTVLHALEYMDIEEPCEHVDFDIRDYRRHVLEHARERLHGHVTGEPQTWCQIEEVVAVNRAYREILQRAASTGADLIVMGAQGHGGMELMLYGSNTQHVVRAATCPVLTVRA
jgi:nucleotide-binding universal stress UspA family protein